MHLLVQPTVVGTPAVPCEGPSPSLLLLSRVSTSGADASTGRGEGFYTISLEPGTYTVAAGADGFHSAGTPQTIEVRHQVAQALLEAHPPHIV